MLAGPGGLPPTGVLVMGFVVQREWNRDPGGAFDDEESVHNRSLIQCARESVRFSLVELVIAVVIIGVIAAMAAPASAVEPRTTSSENLPSVPMRPVLWERLQVSIFEGPYLRTGDKLGTVPVGPNAGDTDVMTTTTALIQDAVCEAAGGSGCVYNYLTCVIIANTDDLDESGVEYNTY